MVSFYPDDERKLNETGHGQKTGRTKQRNTCPHKNGENFNNCSIEIGELKFYDCDEK
jgi:hypothetical protein